MDPIKYFTFSMIIFILGIWGILLNRRNKEKNNFVFFFEVTGATFFSLGLFCLIDFMAPHVSYCAGRSAFTPSPSPAQSPGEEPAVPEEAPPMPQQVVLISDAERRRELFDRSLIHHFFRPDRTLRESINVVELQFSIERRVEAALVADGFDPASILANRHRIRGVLFYPFWDLLTERTYRAYVTQIESNGTRESLPYRRVVRAVQNYDLFL